MMDPFAIMSTSFSDGNVIQSFTQDFGEGIGVATGVTVKANDKMSRDIGWFSDAVTLRDGSISDEAHLTIGFPAGSAVGAGGAVISGMGKSPKLLKGGKKVVDFMKGGKKAARDRNFGIKDKGFWKWWHKRKGKMSGKGRGKDIKSKSQADDLYREYKNPGG